MDLIMHADYAALEELGATPDTMNLVDRGEMARVIELGGEPQRTPGGSCANTLRGFSWLSQGELEQPVFMGAVGEDDDGTIFENILEKLKVRPALSFKSTPTGKSAIIVTPDYKRTMFTYLGACRDFDQDDVEWDLFTKADYFYTTGFMWDTENQKLATRRAIEAALKNETTIIFDLADPFVVERYRDELRDYLPGKIDVLFANRDELKAMTGKSSNSDILEAASYLADMVVMKTGAEGCSLLIDGVMKSIPGNKVEPRDTTGAGDSFASGFLYGIIKGRSPEESGKLANKLASSIVTVEGCDYSRLNRGKVIESGS
jgi:sugar/nucleoside kinase (ribokinase family)